MAAKVYLAVDLGAEGGRVMAGIWDGNKLKLEEIDRFPNGPVALGKTIRWDALRLCAEIQSGLALAGKQVKSDGELGSLTEMRDVVRASRSVQRFEPAAWNEAADRFAELRR